jgi:hypothetical protein
VLLSDTRRHLSCPSARCTPGATLLGVMMPDGRVAFARDRIVVTEAFAEAAADTGSPERRFRFASACVRGACRQWRGDRCGVIEDVLASDLPPGSTSSTLPQCSIRPDCRWFHQAGAAACQACPLVVTDSNGTS